MSARNKGDGRGARAAARVKRKQMQSDDGWTVITRGLSSISLHDQEGKTRESAASATPPPMVKDLTAEKLLAEFKMLQERWEDTALAVQVGQIIEAEKKEETECGVDEAVCIGIGSFSRDWAHRWRSLWQLVLFVDVVGRFTSEKQDKQMPCYAQDPAFTPLDTEFLSLLCITALDAGLENKITSRSFVYSPFVDWFLLLPTFLAGRNPVLYVGNEILDDYSMYAQSSEKRERLDECNEVGRKWLAERRVVRLREFEKHANALNGMVVYLRQGEDG